MCGSGANGGMLLLNECGVNLPKDSLSAVETPLSMVLRKNFI